MFQNIGTRDFFALKQEIVVKGNNLMEIQELTKA